jgi:hypothetical protein
MHLLQKTSLYHPRHSGNYKRLIMRKFDIKTPKAEWPRFPLYSPRKGNLLVILKTVFKVAFYISLFYLKSVICFV